MVPQNTHAHREKLRATFVMEQQLGHATYYQNLRSQLDDNALDDNALDDNALDDNALDDNVHLEIHWVEALYDPAGTIWQKLPGIPQRVRNILGATGHVQRGLQAQPWDVAFFNTHVPARMAGRMRGRGPYVVTSDITPLLHDTMSEHYGRPVDTNPLTRWYKHKLHTTMFQGAARLLPWSHWVGDSLIADYGVDPAKVEVIPPGVDLTQWQPASSRLGSKDNGDKVRLLFVGGDFYRKGGALLLRAFAQLPQETVHLDIVTRTQVELGKLEAGQNIAVHHGMVPNAPELLALYQTSDIFVFPTQAEAFGIAAAEAAAVGLPVVASKVGGLEDIVLQGKTGFLFDQGDESRLLNYLEELVASPTKRADMGTVAREHAVKHFDLERNAARILEIVIQVAQA